MKKPSSRLFKILYAGMFLGAILAVSVPTAATAWRSMRSGAEGVPLTQTISKALTDEFPGHDRLIDLYGGLMRILGRRLCNGTVRTTDGRLIRESGYRDVRPYADALKREVDLLSGTPFLFVSAPDCVDRYQRCLPYGLHAEANRCARELMDMLKEKGIESLNLEDYLTDTPESVLRHYYKTDFHWNSLAARKVAALVTERICRRLEIEQPDVRELFLDDGNWVSHTEHDAWLGRLGARVGRFFVGLEDFTWYTTARKARMSSYIASGFQRRGDFNSVAVSKKYLESFGRYHEVTGAFGGSPDLALGGKCRGMKIFVNEDAPINRRITVIKDSYGRSAAACMALAFHEVVMLDARHLPKGTSLRDAVSDSHPDMVVEIISSGWAAARIERRIAAPVTYKWQFFKWKKGGR